MATYPRVQALTAAGITPSIPIDLSNFGYGVGIVVGFGVGTVAIYSVEATGDRLDIADASKLWVALPLLTNQNSAQTSNLAFPVTAVRLNAGTVSGTVQLSVIQVT